ncbi:MAG: hypothetical protein ACYCXB_04945 [Candidatus Humimicrobiaceae bacterium]
MTPKERVITALSHKEPDRVPRSASFTPEFADKLRKRLGLESILFNPHGGTEHELELKVGNDLLLTGQGFANSYYQSLENNYTDEWGIEWKIVKYNTRLGEGHYTEINTHPLSSDNAINSYIPPSADVKNRYGPSKELIDTYGKEYPIAGVIQYLKQHGLSEALIN